MDDNQNLDQDIPDDPNEKIILKKSKGDRSYQRYNNFDPFFGYKSKLFW